MIPPAKPYFPDRDMSQILEDIKTTLKGGMLTINKKTEEFENKFKEYTNSKYAIAVNSGTAALHLSLVASEIKKGDEVLVPTNTFSASVASIIMANAKPVLVDVDEKSYCIDICDIVEKITKKTKAIMPVHHSGNMCDMERINQIAEENNLIVIEDAAHAHGSRLNGIHAGNFGITGAFSFYPTKNMTSAEGGMIITNDAEIDRKVRIMRDQGKKDFYSMDIVELGYNYRMSELHSILGLEQLKHLEEWVVRRNEIARQFDKTIDKIGLIKPFVKPNVRHSFYKYMVKVVDGINREELRKKLKEKGISTSLQYDPMVHHLSYYKYLDTGFPIANKIEKTVFSLPTFNGMSDEEVKTVCDGLVEAME